MKPIAIVGAGGFAKEVKWLIDRMNQKEKCWNFIGFVDEDITKPYVIGNDKFLIEYSDEIYVVIAIGNPSVRRRIASKYSANANIRFPNLIDPSVIMSDSIKIGEGNIICAGDILTVDISIGNHNIINLDCTVGHDAIIGDYVTINPSSNISGKVNIDSETDIGTGVQIIQGINIGKRTTVGAGAVVTKDLPGNCTAVGVPAQIIKCKES